MEKFIYKNNDRGETVVTGLNPEWEIKERERKLNVMLEYSGIPLQYRHFTFEKFESNIKQSHENLLLCKKYSMNPRDSQLKDISLYLYGPNTAGKSTIACAMAQEMMARSLFVKYIGFGSLIDTIVLSHDFKLGEQAREILSQFDKCDIIILDDSFDPNKSTTYRDSKLIIQGLDKFLRKHFDDRRRFIFTSNKKIVDIANIYSVDIYDMVDRNSISMEFLDDIKFIKKEQHKSINWREIPDSPTKTA